MTDFILALEPLSLPVYIMLALVSYDIGDNPFSDKYTVKLVDRLYKSCIATRQKRLAIHAKARLGRSRSAASNSRSATAPVGNKTHSKKQQG